MGYIERNGLMSHKQISKKNDLGSDGIPVKVAIFLGSPGYWCTCLAEDMEEPETRGRAVSPHRLDPTTLVIGVASSSWSPGKQRWTIWIRLSPSRMDHLRCRAACCSSVDVL